MKEHGKHNLFLSLKTDVPNPNLSKNPANHLFFLLKTLNNRIYLSLQASYKIFLFKIYRCHLCPQRPNLFSSPSNKVNILHFYEFVFGLVEIK